MSTVRQSADFGSTMSTRKKREQLEQQDENQGCIMAAVQEFLDAHGEIGYVMKLKGSVIPKAIVFAFPSGCLAVGLHYFYGWIGTVPDHLMKGFGVWATFTTILGMLIVFRTNQAYNRYWEGATLLLQVRGEWLNACSSLFAFCSAEDHQRDAVLRFQHQMIRLMSMLYCAALQNVALVGDESMEIIDMEGLDPGSLRYLINSHERCDVLLQWIRRLVVQSMSRGVIPVPPPILTRVFQELSRGIVNAKDVQKIAEFPFPFPYTQMIVCMMLLQSLTTPMLVSISGVDVYSAFFITFVVVLALWCMNYIAGELEQPFGEDFNDLPIPQMMADMNDRLKTLMQAETQTPPHFNFHKAMHECRVMSCEEAGYSSTATFIPGALSKSGSSLGFGRYSSEASTRSRRPSFHDKRTLSRGLSTVSQGMNGKPSIPEGDEGNLPTMLLSEQAPELRGQGSTVGGPFDPPSREGRGQSKNSSAGDSQLSFGPGGPGVEESGRSSSRSRGGEGGSHHLGGNKRILPPIPSSSPYFSGASGLSGESAHTTGLEMDPRLFSKASGAGHPGLSRSASHLSHHDGRPASPRNRSPQRRPSYNAVAAQMVMMRLPELFPSMISVEDPFAGPPITGPPTGLSCGSSDGSDFIVHEPGGGYHHWRDDNLPHEGETPHKMTAAKPTPLNFREWQDKSRTRTKGGGGDEAPRGPGPRHAVWQKPDEDPPGDGDIVVAM